VFRDTWLGAETISDGGGLVDAVLRGSKAFGMWPEDGAWPHPAQLRRRPRELQISEVETYRE
jgi:hypothetical protein